MAFTKSTTDLNIIQALDDEPNDVGGLSSAEFKEKFDTAGNTLQTFANTHIDELTAKTAAANIGAVAADGSTASTIQAELANLHGDQHTHTNKTVLDGIAADDVANWDSAHNKEHTHDNKTALDTVPAGGVVTALGGDDTTIPTSKAVSDAMAQAGNLPSGGTTGQVLQKKSDSSYDTEWGAVDLAAKQDKIMASGILKGDGEGGTSTADAASLKTLLDTLTAVSPATGDKIPLTDISGGIAGYSTIANIRALVTPSIYTGTTEPSGSTGVDGDFYFKTK